MDIEIIKKSKTNRIGKKIEYYNEIHSTHEYAKTIASKKEEDGKIVIAAKQTNGIGTNGRTWFTNSDGNIAMTIILNIDLKKEILNNLTINIAKYLKSIIFTIYGYTVDIKLPNDIMVNNKKIAGILTQVNTMGEDIRYLLISIGMNVNSLEFPKEIENIASSLKKEFNQEFDLEKIISKFIEILEKEILEN